MSKTYDVAVVGATGAVGRTMLDILAERKFPVGRVHALASERSAGKSISFNGHRLIVQNLAEFDFSNTKIGLFSAGSSISRVYAPKAVDAGCVVIDNTSQFRYDDDIPLIVPEVNPEAIGAYTSRGIIANPNCSTIQMVVAVKPVYDEVGIERINVCTYQAVSGSGQSAIEELRTQTAALLNGEKVENSVYPKRIAFNALPHIDVFQDNGYTKEEMKLVWETRKIMGDESIRVNATNVRIPVFYGHSEAVHLETRRKIGIERVRELLQNAPGVEVMDDPVHAGYPTAATEAAHRDAVFVGRLRNDISHDRGLNMWIVADNVRKGAALNSVQIAEYLIKSYM